MDRISEMELKALVSSEVAPSFFAKLGGLERLSNKFLIEKKVDYVISDTYFDTKDLVLWQKRGYLRLREFENNGDRILTYRKETPGVYGERIEASCRSVSEMETVLRELDVDIPGLLAGKNYKGSEKETLSFLGFLTLASFSIKRKVLRVAKRNSREKINVKLDEVWFPSEKEAFYEVEINCFSKETMGDAFGIFEVLNFLSGGNLVLSSEFKVETCLLLKKMREAIRRG